MGAAYIIHLYGAPAFLRFLKALSGLLEGVTVPPHLSDADLELLSRLRSKDSSGLTALIKRR